MELDQEAAKMLSSLYADFHDMRIHVEVLNHEGSEMRDEQKKMNITLGDLSVQHAEMKTDIDWLKRSTWFIAGTSVTTLIAVILQFIFRK